jgi:hypothetical protein
MDSALGDGRAAYARRAWDDAFRALSRARGEQPLDADDQERLALCAGLTGRDEDAVEAFAALYELLIAAGDLPRAARAAFWAAMRLFSLGESAQGGGWLGRAQRLVDGRDCVESGFLRLPLVFRHNATGDYAAARAAASDAVEVGTRFGDPDLTSLGTTFEGRVRDG